MNSSRFKIVCWDKTNNKWKAIYKRTHLGYHATEKAAARAYGRYVKDGIDHTMRREASTSQFSGVSWAKTVRKWMSQIRRKTLGYYTTAEGAAQAYNVEAERLGLALNIIPTIGYAGAGEGAGAGAGGNAGP